MAPVSMLDASPLPTAGPFPPDVSGRSRILVVDDVRGILDALQLLLAEHGFTVTTSTSPDEAVAAASSQAFDVALIDLNFGEGRTTGEQGLDLIETLRALDGALSIVAMTAWSSHELAREAMHRGAKDFVEKPWDERRLIPILRSQVELSTAVRRVTELETELQRVRAERTAGTPVTEMQLLDMEALLVRQAIDRFHGNISRAARALGLSRSALYRRLERHRIAHRH